MRQQQRQHTARPPAPPPRRQRMRSEVVDPGGLARRGPEAPAAVGLRELRGVVLRRHYRAADRKDGLRCPAGCSGGTTRFRGGGRPAGSFAHAQAGRLHEKPVSERRAPCARPSSVRMRQRRSPGCESVGGAHARVLRPQYWRARRGDARRCSAHALPRRLQGRGVTAAGRQSPGAARAAEGPSGSSAPSTARRSPRGRGVKGLTAREGLPRPLSGVQGTCLSCPAETGPRVSRGRMVRPLIKSPSEVSSLGAQNVSSDLPHHSPQMQSVPPCSQKRSPTCGKRLPFLTEGAGCPTITIHLGIYCS